MTECLTCALVARRDAGTAPVWDSIVRTQYWDVVHSYNTSLLGWIVLVIRRHIEAVDEMTEDEAVELGKLMRHVSIILKTETGCTKTYVVQFAEAKEHPHVHFHIIPRMPDQPDEYKGPGIFKRLGVPEAERVDEAAMTALSLRVRQKLNEAGWA